MKDKGRIKSKYYAYLSGLVDGDGSLSIRFADGQGYQLTLSVYSTNRPLMNFLVLHFGGQFRKMPTEGNRKQKYQWYTNHNILISTLTPYLHLKNNQGMIARQFFSLNSERLPEARQELMNDLSIANNFFEPVNTKFHIKKQHEPSKDDFATLAGLLDAEGSFSIYKRKSKGNGQYTSAIRFSNTDARIFPWIMERFGGRFTKTTRGINRNEGCWTMSGEDRERFLLGILPYMVVKRQQAIIILEWIRKNRNRRDASFTAEQREDYFQRLRKLNFRGLSPEINTSGSPDSGLKIESALLRENVASVMTIT